MAKVFTITSGLENMGAMKTGGQGSVYKGRRIGEIITAIKLLPTPIYSESEDDKNFRDFNNEVQKLKRVNEEPNPNVVKILSSGLSETGNFPFIEMEYIEGPDLEELLKPPYDPIFTIKEVLKVAEHLSNALAHCHKQGVRHGDIKSNNVKYNFHTGNYILLDFGLAIMSDEQRRSSLRQAGAVEFMAPEQNEGQMLFQTDVYSFGVIIFELIAGRVPFQLNDKGETARNIIRLAHIETPAPDIIPIRKENMPAAWPEEKKEMELHVPDWVLKMMYKCLNKKPESRFSNGIELHDFIQHNIAHASEKDEAPFLPQKLVREKEQLQKQVIQFQQLLNSKEQELAELKKQASLNPNIPPIPKESYSSVSNNQSGKSGVSKTTFFTLLIITIALGAFSAYSFFSSNTKENPSIIENIPASNDSTDTITNSPDGNIIEKKEDQPVQTIVKNEKAKDTLPKTSIVPVPKKPKETKDSTIEEGNDNEENKKDETEKTPKKSSQYMVVSRAYFYTEPNESTKRAAYIIPSNSTIVTALDEKDDFIYIIFDNQVAKTSGWIRKKDLQALNE